MYKYDLGSKNHVLAVLIVCTSVTHISKKPLLQMAPAEMSVLLAPIEASEVPPNKVSPAQELWGGGTRHSPFCQPAGLLGQERHVIGVTCGFWLCD